MRAFHNDAFALQLPTSHPFPSSKYRLLREAVQRDLPAIRLTEAAPASDGELALAHEPGWIEAVSAGTMTPAQQREIGFPWSESLVQRSRRSVGATIAAARTALFGMEAAQDDGSARGEPEGVAAHLGGGTHHAYAHKGSGYCVFNDVAVAARLMQVECHRRHAGRPGARQLRVLVIDLDVHQGNGTARIFADDPSVFTLSLHGAKNFPFRKERSDLDVELPDGCDDRAYLDALDAALGEAFARHGDALPGLAFYLAGADAHEGDRLGRLNLSCQGLAERDRRVLHALSERRIPVAVTMAGGYGRDIAVTVALHQQTLALAWRAWSTWQGRARLQGRLRDGCCPQSEEQCGP